MRASMSRRPQQFNFDETIDLHGLSADDALREVERFVYSLPGRKSVAFIHGRGDGVLKQTIRAALQTNPCVDETLYGEDYNFPGGDGVTVVYTK